jgi:hypothetical protein
VAAIGDNRFHSRLQLDVLKQSNGGRSPIRANLFRMFFVNLPQNRHPERSASLIYRVIQRLMARSRRTSAAPISPMLFGAFRPPKPENRIYCDTHLMVTGTSFHAL